MFHITSKTCWNHLSAVTIVHSKHSSDHVPSWLNNFPWQKHESANYGSWGKPSLVFVFVHDLLLEHSHPHSFIYCPWLPSVLQGQNWVALTGTLPAYKDEHIDSLAFSWSPSLKAWACHRPLPIFPTSSSPQLLQTRLALSHWPMIYPTPWKRKILVYEPSSSNQTPLAPSPSINSLIIFNSAPTSSSLCPIPWPLRGGR